MMTLDELIRQLEAERERLGRGDSPVMIEGHDEDENLVQACIDRVSSEYRCEADGEPPGLYLHVSELSIG